MSVEPSEFMSEAWTRFQGHTVNGVYPLGRFLGSSDHSAVFLTRCAAHPAEVAIKLVPTNRARAEIQLPRWKRAGSLTHPHLLRLLEWGGCQLDGLPYLYSVMEYADQTLAQLLLHRALTSEEAREMLPPLLQALVFLHERNLVQGQLKPTNVLVVGDQLKLASDTIRRTSEGTPEEVALTAYDPPERGSGSSSPAGDVWGLGITLCEALTRRQPAGLGESQPAVVLPADFPPSFRDIVGRCLSLRAVQRPSSPELVSWATGRPMSAAGVSPEPAMSQGVARQEAIAKAAPAPVRSAASVVTGMRSRTLLSVILAAALVVALGWATVRLLSARHDATPTVVPAPVAAAAPSAALSDVVQPPPPGPIPSAKPAGSAAVTPPSAALHEAIPEVPAGARRSIRGHIKVWVRVIVEQDGSVSAASPDRSGPSGYFERLALEAARKWTFPPAETPSRRLMQIRFDFSRDGTTGHAVAVNK